MKAGLTVLALFAIIENSLVAIAIWKRPKLRNPNNILIANLALADILHGLKLLLLRLFFGTDDFKFESKFLACAFFNGSILILTYLPRLLFVFVSLDRCFAVRWPFIYVQCADVSSALFITGFAFVLAAFFTSLSYLGWNVQETYNNTCTFYEINPLGYLFYINVLALYLLPLIIIICIHVYIAKVIRQHEIRMSTFDVNRKSHVKYSRIKMLALAIACHFVFLFPLKFIDAVCYLTSENLPWSQHVHEVFYYVAVLMANSISLINPFIYASNKAIRKEIVYIITCKAFRSKTPVLPISKRSSNTNTQTKETCTSSEESSICGPFNVPRMNRKAMLKFLFSRHRSSKVSTNPNFSDITSFLGTQSNLENSKQISDYNKTSLFSFGTKLSTAKSNIIIPSEYSSVSGESSIFEGSKHMTEGNKTSLESSNKRVKYAQTILFSEYSSNLGKSSNLEEQKQISDTNKTSLSSTSI